MKSRNVEFQNSCSGKNNTLVKYTWIQLYSKDEIEWVYTTYTCRYYFTDHGIKLHHIYNVLQTDKWKFVDALILAHNQQKYVKIPLLNPSCYHSVQWL